MVVGDLRTLRVCASRFGLSTARTRSLTWWEEWTRRGVRMVQCASRGQELWYVQPQEQ